MIGVMLSKFLPPVAVTGLLVLYLFYSTWKMFSKAREVTKKENKQRKEVKDALEAKRSSDAEITEVEMTREVTADTVGVNVAASVNVELLALCQNEKFTTKFLCKKEVCNLFLLVSSFAFVLLVALLRGGHGAESIIGIGSCSATSWILLTCSQLMGFGLAVMGYYLNKNHFQEEDGGEAKKIKQRRMILIMSYFTGIAAGTLGIGGGMILGPFMLGLGMDPAVSTALSGFTVLFTSSSTTSQFIIAGAIHLQHAWVFMVWSLIGSFIGNLVLKRLIKKYNRPSIIIWVIFGILCLSCLVLPAQTIYNAIVKEGALSFGAVC